MAKDNQVGRQPLHRISLYLPDLMELAEDVTHQYRAARQALDSLCGVQAWTVIIPGDSKHRRNLLELAYHFNSADISCVDDAIDPCEYWHDCRVESTMCI